MQIDGTLAGTDQPERIRLILQGLAEEQMTLIDAKDAQGVFHMIMCCNDPDLGNIAVLDEDRAFLISEGFLDFHTLN